MLHQREKSLTRNCISEKGSSLSLMLHNCEMSLWSPGTEPCPTRSLAPEHNFFCKCFQYWKEPCFPTRAFTLWNALSSQLSSLQPSASVLGPRYTHFPATSRGWRSVSRPCGAGSRPLRSCLWYLSLGNLLISAANKPHCKAALPARGALVRATNQGPAQGRQIYYWQNSTHRAQPSGSYQGLEINRIFNCSCIFNSSCPNGRARMWCFAKEDLISGGPEQMGIVGGGKGDLRVLTSSNAVAALQVWVRGARAGPPKPGLIRLAGWVLWDTHAHSAIWGPLHGTLHMHPLHKTHSQPERRSAPSLFRVESPGVVPHTWAALQWAHLPHRRPDLRLSLSLDNNNQSHFLRGVQRRNHLYPI